MIFLFQLQNLSKAFAIISCSGLESLYLLATFRQALTDFLICSIIFNAFSLLSRKNSITSNGKSRSSELSSREILRDKPVPSSFGLISNAGERIHPFSVKMKPWFLR